MLNLRWLVTASPEKSGDGLGSRLNVPPQGLGMMVAFA